MDLQDNSRLLSPVTTVHRTRERVDLDPIPSLPYRPIPAQRTSIRRKSRLPFPRRRFFGRREGVERPEKTESFGNKKAKFSNERTMVHWIKAAILLGNLAMTLLSFSDNNITPYIGVAILMICLMTLIYSTTVFHVRMEWLNMRRDDVNYYDRLAPTVLTILLVAIFAFDAATKCTSQS